MFKTTLVIAFCVVALVECKPSQVNQTNHRVARQIQDPLASGISAAAQMAAAAAEAAQRAVNMGKQAMLGVANGAMGTMQGAAAAVHG